MRNSLSMNLTKKRYHLHQICSIMTQSLRPYLKVSNPFNHIIINIITQCINNNYFIIDLPRISLIVLITAKKVAEKASLFNFEAVYQEYRRFMFAQ